MATILLVEDEPDLGLYEAVVLETRGHRVLRCSGGPSPFAACPMMQRTPCAIADVADVIVFSCGMFAPVAHRSYRGEHLLRAYRAHPFYGRKPMLVVSLAKPVGVGGRGPLAFVEKFTQPAAVVEAVDDLLAARSR